MLQDIIDQVISESEILNSPQDLMNRCDALCEF